MTNSTLCNTVQNRLFVCECSANSCSELRNVETWVSDFIHTDANWTQWNEYAWHKKHHNCSCQLDVLEYEMITCQSPVWWRWFVFIYLKCYNMCMSRSAPPAHNWFDLRTALLLIVWNMAHSHKYDYPYTLHIHSFFPIYV